MVLRSQRMPPSESGAGGRAWQLKRGKHEESRPDGAEPGGAHLENLIACGLFAWRETRHRRPNILVWRTSKGTEVDFVVETPRQLIPVEVRSSRSVRTLPGDVHRGIPGSGPCGGAAVHRPRSLLAQRARTRGPLVRDDLMCLQEGAAAGCRIAQTGG